MSVLFFWVGKNYRKDLTDGSATSYWLNQNSELLYNLKQGEHVWAFTRKNDGTYVLAADLVVKTTGKNQKGDSNYDYGIYHAIGMKTTRYFDTEKGPDAEALIRLLSFEPQAKTLGWSFQGRNAVRHLEHTDEKKLEEFAKNLPLIP